ncbi:hypothetical protein SedNR2807_42210 [Citrobacter sedlakii]
MGASGVRLFTYITPDAANNPALQTSASTWGLKGNVIFLLPIPEEIAMVELLPPAGAVLREYKETIV